MVSKSIPSENPSNICSNLAFLQYFPKIQGEKVLTISQSSIIIYFAVFEKMKKMGYKGG